MSSVDPVLFFVNKSYFRTRGLLIIHLIHSIKISYLSHTLQPIMISNCINLIALTEMSLNTYQAFKWDICTEGTA